MGSSELRSTSRPASNAHLSMRPEIDDSLPGPLGPSEPEERVDVQFHDSGYKHAGL